MREKGSWESSRCFFRTGRHIEDNLFGLTQCIEIAELTQSLLYMATLDLKMAYDCVHTSILWRILQEMGLSVGDTQLREAMYIGLMAKVEWSSITKDPISIKRGLCQGCPLSSLLFMVYLVGIAQRLEALQCGFTLQHRVQGQQVVQQILPALMYADDITLLAGSAEYLQRLQGACGDAIDDLGLKFNQAKCRVMAWSFE